jgi:DNA-binding NarL/FixJ family response regulator
MEEIISEAENITAIHRAVSYEEAKNPFKKNKYAAVLLDINLPGNESLKLVKEIKDTGGKTCVIIMFTHMDNYILEQCKSLGADFFFDKYYDFEKIGGATYSIGQFEKNLQSTSFSIS